MKRNELQSMANLRVKDSELLLLAGHWSAAYYLCGYAVELGLKACISKQFAVNTIPDRTLVSKIFTHDFDVLIGLAGLRTELKAEIDRSADFGGSWGICKEWTPDARYGSWEEADARSLFYAVADDTNGLLKWIKAHW